eukprot:336292-Chlamydomonas_euryale.AAC.1
MQCRGRCMWGRCTRATWEGLGAACMPAADTPAPRQAALSGTIAACAYAHCFSEAPSCIAALAVTAFCPSAA